MLHVGVDLHKSYAQVAVIEESGEMNGGSPKKGLDTANLLRDEIRPVGKQINLREWAW